MNEAEKKPSSHRLTLIEGDRIPQTPPEALVEWPAGRPPGRPARQPSRRKTTNQARQVSQTPRPGSAGPFFLLQRNRSSAMTETFIPLPINSRAAPTTPSPSPWNTNRKPAGGSANAGKPAQPPSRNQGTSAGRTGIQHPAPAQRTGKHQPPARTPGPMGHRPDPAADQQCTAPAGTAGFNRGTFIAPRKLPAENHKAAEGGYWAVVPARPGCNSQGETPEELKANIREAITAWLNARREEHCTAAPSLPRKNKAARPARYGTRRTTVLWVPYAKRHYNPNEPPS